MRVSDSARVLFVHVQKTGGSPVDHIFDTEVPDSRRVAERSRHSPYGRLLTAEPELADYWSFAFVRNPWARLVSWYTMISTIFEKYEQGDPIMLAKVARVPGVWLPYQPYSRDFDKFVLEGVEANAKLRRAQVDMVRTRRGLEVDFIARTENFNHDLNIAREHLSLPPLQEVPRLNATSGGHYSEWYGDVTRRKAAELFARDIDAFGYTFDRQ